MSKMGTECRHIVVITCKIPTYGPAFQELMKTCEIKCYDASAIMPREDFLKAVLGVDAILCQSEDICDREILDNAGPQLKVIATNSVGFENIDLPECAKRNIKVGYTPDVATDTVAEATIGLLIATARHFKQGMTVVSGGTAFEIMSKNPYVFCGPTISGSVVGIVGLGRIGLAVAKRLVSFGVDSFLYCGSRPKEHAVEVNAKFVTFDQLLAQSDFVICCCSLKPENIEMFNAVAFKKMKKSAVFINTSRGAIVDQEALYEALKTNEILAAGLDVTSPEPLPLAHPLLSLNNCLILPHIACNSLSAVNKKAELSARNILSGLRGEPLITPLAF